jgi:hypothetical protein
LKSITQLPAALKVTTPPEIEHTDVLEESIVIATASPELAVAAGVYVPPTFAGLGGVEVTVIVCAVFVGEVTVTDCCTCGAAA